jgi:hypothetical protein
MSVVVFAASLKRQSKDTKNPLVHTTEDLQLNLENPDVFSPIET